MRILPLILLISAATCLSAILTAQSVAYVDGENGSDSAGHGASITQPWRTITYALSQIGIPGNGSTTTLVVAGNFTYAATTNGEVFPISLPPCVILQGGTAAPDSQPILAAPPGSMIVALATDASYGTGQPQVIDVTFQGGATGIGSIPATNHSHSIRIQNCHFSQQSAQGIGIDGSFGSISLSITDSSFSNTNVGINIANAFPWTPTASQFRLDSCTLQHLTTAINCEGSGIADMQMDRCDISYCNRGIRSPGMSCTVELQNCHVHECMTGIDLGPQWSRSPNFEARITDSSFTLCTLGLSIQTHGNASIALRGSSFSNCTIGVRDLGPYLSHNTDAVACDFLDTQVGLQIGFDIHAQYCRIQQCRFLRGNIGVQLEGHDYGVGFQLTIANSLFAGHNSASIMATPSLVSPAYGSHEIAIDSSTFADSNVSLQLNTINTTSRATSSVFSGNTVDVIAPPTFSCIACLTDAASLQGTLNTVLTNADLLRPSYKLAPTSPCIDALSTPTSTQLDYEGDPRPSSGTLGGPALSDIGADEFVATGSLHTFGLPVTGPASWRPRIHTPDTSASIGSSFLVELTGGPAQGSAAILAIGFTEPAPPQPFDLSAVGIEGSLWVTPEILQAPVNVDSTGYVSYQQQVPPYTWLVGLPVHYQWLVVSGSTWRTSDALRVTVGW